MILFVPAAFVAAVVAVLFLLVRALRAALPDDLAVPGWRRAVVSLAYVCAAVTAGSWSLGALNLMMTVATAQDGGADSAPFPYDHPCRLHQTGAVDYEIGFVTLSTHCVMPDGSLREVPDVPRPVRVTAAVSAACTALTAGAAFAASGAGTRVPRAGDRA